MHSNVSNVEYDVPLAPFLDSGLSGRDANARLARYGRNVLPEPRSAFFLATFLRQFRSPLIYILLAAALVSLAMSDVKDALFIGVVLLINGIIGGVQEHSAGRAAAALRKLEQPHATVVRDGQAQEIDAQLLVPGDVVLLDAGGRVPADISLRAVNDLLCDESLLTGESAPVRKNASTGKGLDDRRECAAFAGALITRGRGRGVVIATGAATEIGQIAAELGKADASRPPLMIRLEQFSHMIAYMVAIAVALLIVVGLARGLTLYDLFMMSVGLAVSAIPEGLPVAISVALAISMRRMAKANVIVGQWRRSNPSAHAPDRNRQNRHSDPQRIDGDGYTPARRYGTGTLGGSRSRGVPHPRPRNNSWRMPVRRAHASSGCDIAKRGRDSRRKVTAGRASAIPSTWRYLQRPARRGSSRRPSRMTIHCLRASPMNRILNMPRPSIAGETVSTFSSRARPKP